jgi:hypothetical protein
MYYYKKRVLIENPFFYGLFTSSDVREKPFCKKVFERHQEPAYRQAGIDCRKAQANDY